MPKRLSSSKYKRSSATATSRRIDSYPADWLAATIDDPLVATLNEDFTVTASVFVQDVYRLARRATTRAKYAGEETGYRAHTFTAGLDAGDVGFYFSRVPFEDMGKSIRLPKFTNADREKAKQQVEREIRGQVPLVNLFLCREQGGSSMAHEQGAVNAGWCDRCAEVAAAEEAVAETPDPGSSPSRPWSVESPDLASPTVTVLEQDGNWVDGAWVPGPVTSREIPAPHCDELAYDAVGTAHEVDPRASFGIDEAWEQGSYSEDPEEVTTFHDTSVVLQQPVRVEQPTPPLPPVQAWTPPVIQAPVTRPPGYDAVAEILREHGE